MVFEQVLWLGLAFLLAPVFAEWAKLRHKAEKGFNWFAVAGAFFLFSAVFVGIPSVGTTGVLGVVAPLGQVFEIIGFLFALIGTIFIAYEALLEK
jgi:uncharacterized membrane protein HdeD (DUF308 family)